MSIPPPERSNVWPWIWGFVLIFLAHVAAVFWLNERSRPIVAPAKPKPLAHVATGQAGLRRLAELAGPDPALFALPSEIGFSGEAWLSFAPVEITTSNWTAPPAWLPQGLEQLGAPFVAVAETNRVPVDALLDNLGDASPFELRIVPGLLQPRSELTLEAPLKDRAFQWINNLPFATNSDPLSNTVVEVAVNGNGIVESFTLLSGSGVSDVDEAALTIASRLRFRPLPLPRSEREKSVPTRGKATFAWRVVPAPLTNGLTATATP